MLYRKFGINLNDFLNVKRKAEAFVESMLVLGAPNIDQLDENEVHRCFRRKALQCHPDRLPIDATEEDKVKAKLNWYTIEMARDMLLKYCENPSIMSIQLKKMVKQIYRKYNGEVNMIKLMEHLEGLKLDNISGAIEIKT